MKPSLPIFVLSATLCLGLGCGAKNEDTVAKADAATKTGPATKAEQAPAPGGDPAAVHEDRVNPHIIPPHNKPPAAAAPLGPPREVSPSGELRDESVDGLHMPVPKEWERAEVSSTMRKGAFTIPGPGGDAQLVVYRFPGGAGTPEQNIDRWKGQVEGGDAKITEVEANGLKIMALDVNGRFAGQAMPGVPPTPAIEEARMFAAAIGGSGDPWYFKVVGPAKTLDVWAQPWTTLLAALEPAA